MRGKARSSIWLRIVLAVLAILALAGAGFAAVNIASIGSYNKATQKLEQNLKDAKKSDADLNRLLTQAQQTDSQYQEAGRFSALLAPSIRKKIADNTKLSQSLTTTTQRKLVSIKRQESSGKSGSGANGGQNSQQGKHNGNTQEQGLSEEQRQEIERLLQANQGSTEQNNKPSESQPKPADKDVKPW